jgi:SAM-dependent methyltransferase
MTVLHCPSCESPRHDLVFTSWNGYPIRRCESCHLVFTDDREAPPPETLYPHFEQSDNVARKNVRSALSVFSDQRAAVVERMSKRSAQAHHSGSKKRLLDYGCGSGAFARFMVGRGYDVVGLEPFSLGSPTSEDSLTLLRKPFESARAELGTFDVITLWHVLEHVHKPIELLRALGEHLAPEGVIVISVPNFKSVQSELFKGAWFHLDPPRHLIHFEPDTLTSTVEQAGLRQVDEAPFLPEYGTSGWVQSVLNRVLPHKNFLFELVKDRGALRAMSGASTAAHAAASIALGAPVLAASLPIEAVAARSNRAGALTIAARRA